MFYHQILLAAIQFMDKEKEIIIQFFLEKLPPYLEFHNKQVPIFNPMIITFTKKIRKSFTKEFFHFQRFNHVQYCHPQEKK